MIRIAHITDLHLVEPDYARRSAGDRRRLRYLNAGRDIDPAPRRARARDALRAARGADHIVVTGDLTEDGTPAQFEAVGELLAEAGIAPERVTLVPGNHDFYAAPDAFVRALRGPLRAYAKSSTPSQPVDLGAALILPVCTAVAQSYLRSGGVLSRHDSERMGALARLRRTLIVAQHHPPFRHRNPIRHWIDGLRNAAASAALLMMHAHVHVLHGHLHVAASRTVGADRAAQMHCAAAVLESAAHVRFYDVDSGVFDPT